MPVIRTATATVPVTVRHNGAGGFSGSIPLAAGGGSGYWTVPFIEQQRRKPASILTRLLHPYGLLNIRPSEAAPTKWILDGAFDAPGTGLLDFDLLVDSEVVLTYTGDVTEGQEIAVQAEVALQGGENVEIRVRSFPGDLVPDQGASSPSANVPA